ncbi:MAG: GDP-mannose 4,6-dehydratase [Planctomycetaceae bacterium]|jgi:GDPmannose 4,6-dehydratase|nr:GDP-mannose 4,6-dehydratase [Planctomycetaceae bacterium]
MAKTALITGITGQDGAYLARLLLDKGYTVHGIRRRSSSVNTARIDEIGQNHDRFHLHYGDMTDAAGLVRILCGTQPDEVYNLAAQSHVQVSFDMPEFTGNVNALGVVRLLEAIRELGWEKKVRFYQASTSELFGGMTAEPCNEQSPFYPRSPYAAAKLYAYWATVNYRESYRMFACNGILFNHESPLRGETFVTRKITKAVCRIEQHLQEKLSVGNLNAKRDWGHAADFVEGMYLMLQQNEPDDYVLATGETRSVREFIEHAFAAAEITLEWQGQGLNEQGIDRKTGKVRVDVDPQFFRPAEVNVLLGDAGKATRKLGWRPKHSFADLVRDMIEHDRRQR